ncbi:PatB family C-S lyase [Desulfosporosinus sp. PR]|uniref:MalY/PatB family protein n=1 Tax=Candidatus Desulfosporosinus nitrosoreducens TaxID=3401928 RepID=UPI0027EDE6A3|nr:PatB family C-S lyase [Desulfosporosinus sp. PR]MDQ7093485.1 PatB family C-S lyase [Desulfosporosinus sp. PR]
MNYNFDQLYDRRRTGSIKWDFNQRIFGREDVLPLWVADMDFLAPEAVVEALVNRAKHGIYGYTDGMDEYYDSLTAWMAERHNWQIQRDWIVFSPGVVPALNELVRALTKPGEKVLLQSPVYPPFFQAIKNHGREVVNSRLNLVDGRYLMDFEDLEEKFAGGVKMMILCSPHNPVGRVWRREELERLGQLCLTYDVLVISDEIHSDLIYDGYRHIPLASLTPELASQSIVCTAPSKTFNLAGLQTSNLIIPNEKYRAAYKSSAGLTGIHHPNLFGITALETAYREGREWLEQLMVYLRGNLEFLTSFTARELPQLGVVQPEGTYLVWLDFRALNLEPKALQEFLVHKAGVGLNAGYSFGPGGEGFERINIGCPRSILTEGLERIKRAWA